MTEREPEWTDEDRGWLLALLAERAAECSGCGHPLDEARDPATAGRWQVRQEICQACLVLEAAADARAEAEANLPKSARQRGLYTGVTLG